MNRYLISDLAKITGGRVVRRTGPAASVRGVVTDSREAVPGTLFVALRGETFDGHDFIAEALSRGCRAVCASKANKLPEGRYSAILVPDTLSAYQKIAGAYRAGRGFRVIGVTGSVGKTSTREFIAAALSRERRIFRTDRNNNNEIGLPKTLLETPPDCGICVVEMGMRAQGEIRALTLIARPDIAVITNIGYAHIEFLGSKENILKAKAEIIEGLKPDGLLILNTDDTMLRDLGEELAEEYRVAEVCTGEPSIRGACFSVRAMNIERGIGKTSFDAVISAWKAAPVVIRHIDIPVPGRHNVLNALFGIAAGVEEDVSLAGMLRGLASYESVGNRQRVIECGGVTVIDDSYNAGPESMLAAIAMLRDSAAGRRKIAVLGGMLELGAFSGPAHVKVGKMCADNGIDLVYCAAAEAKWYREGILSSEAAQGTVLLPFASPEEMTKGLIGELRDNDIVLIKGSRKFRMEKIADAIADARSRTKK